MNPIEEKRGKEIGAHMIRALANLARKQDPTAEEIDLPFHARSENDVTFFPDNRNRGNGIHIVKDTTTGTARATVVITKHYGFGATNYIPMEGYEEDLDALLQFVNKRMEFIGELNKRLQQEMNLVEDEGATDRLLKDLNKLRDSNG